jgi:hypothetical protein
MLRGWEIEFVRTPIKPNEVLEFVRNSAKETQPFSWSKWSYGDLSMETRLSCIELDDLFGTDEFDWDDYSRVFFGISNFDWRTLARGTLADYCKFIAAQVSIIRPKALIEYVRGVNAAYCFMLIRAILQHSGIDSSYIAPSTRIDVLDPAQQGMLLRELLLASSPGFKFNPKVTRHLRQRSWWDIVCLLPIETEGTTFFDVTSFRDLALSFAVVL